MAINLNKLQVNAFNWHWSSILFEMCICTCESNLFIQGSILIINQNNSIAEMQIYICFVDNTWNGSLQFHLFLNNYSSL